MLAVQNFLRKLSNFSIILISFDFRTPVDQEVFLKSLFYNISKHFLQVQLKFYIVDYARLATNEKECHSRLKEFISKTLIFYYIL